MLYIALVVCAISLFIFFVGLGDIHEGELITLSIFGFIIAGIFCFYGFNSIPNKYCLSVDKGKIPVGHAYCDKCINANDARNFYAIQHCHTTVDEKLKNKNN